jgi:hypothetical protein
MRQESCEVQVLLQNTDDLAFFAPTSTIQHSDMLLTQILYFFILVQHFVLTLWSSIHPYVLSFQFLQIN